MPVQTQPRQKALVQGLSEYSWQVMQYTLESCIKNRTLGDKNREIEYEDIKRANRLLYATAILCELICLAIMAVIAGMIY